MLEGSFGRIRRKGYRLLLRVGLLYIVKTAHGYSGHCAEALDPGDSGRVSIETWVLQKGLLVDPCSTMSVFHLGAATVHAGSSISALNQSRDGCDWNSCHILSSFHDDGMKTSPP